MIPISCFSNLATFMRKEKHFNSGMLQILFYLFLKEFYFLLLFYLECPPFTKHSVIADRECYNGGICSKIVTEENASVTFCHILVTPSHTLTRPLSPRRRCYGVPDKSRIFSEIFLRKHTPVKP